MSGSKGQRRPKGTGSLRNLSGNRWQITVKVGGKRLSRVFTARNATEANRAADAVRIELQAARERVKDTAGAEREQRRTWTVEQYIVYYLREWAPHHLANTSRERYSQITKHQIIPHIGKKRMAEVTVADLKGMYSALSGKDSRRYGGTLSGQTILTVHMVVRAIFRFVCDELEDFEKNPASKKAAKPKVEQSVRKRGLDVAEVERFVALVRKQSPDMTAAVMLSAYLGTRRGETLALRWCDVDFKGRELAVRRSVTQTPEDGVKVKNTTKTGKQRIIPLDSDLLKELKTIQRQQREQRMRLGSGWQGADSPADDYLATTPTGTGITPNDFAQGFRTLAKQNKLTHITPHILRHAWVSQMIALGFDAVTIATMTGHSPDVLLRTYAHAFDKRKREAVEALGKARRAVRAAK